MRAWLMFDSHLKLPIFGFVLVLLGGCARKPAAREDETTMDFRQIARVYESIQGYHNRPPKDLDQIKQYLTDLHTDGQNDEPEKVLTSSRDGQPYVIILGAQFGVPPGTQIMFYEKQGAEGKRYVIHADRQVRQLTDEEFRQATFANGHRPESGT